MIVSYSSTEIADLQSSVALMEFSAMELSDNPLTVLARKINLGAYKNRGRLFNMGILHKPVITEEMLHPVRTDIGELARNLKIRMSSKTFVQHLYPARIKYAVDYLDQTVTQVKKIGLWNLHRYKADLSEILNVSTVFEASDKYDCVNGANGKTPTEFTKKDMLAMSAILKARGALQILTQYIATEQISTSGCPKSYALIGSPEAINSIKQDAELLENNTIVNSSFLLPTQMAGSTNYSVNVEGVYVPANITLISSNNFDSSTAINEQYRTILMSDNAFAMASTTPTEEVLFDGSPYKYDSTGLYCEMSIRGSYSSKVLRPEWILKINATNK